LAVSIQESGSIFLYSTVTHTWMTQVVTVHGKHPVTALQYDPLHNCMISGDRAGILEIWDCQGTPQPTRKNNNHERGFWKFGIVTVHRNQHERTTLPTRSTISPPEMATKMTPRRKPAMWRPKSCTWEVPYRPTNTG